VNDSVIIRPATAADVDAIHRLITDNLEVGHLLPRSADDIARCITRFVVATVATAATKRAGPRASTVVGCAELAPLSTGVAEVRSLVVSEAFRGRQIGPNLVSRVAADATAKGFATLCAFAHEPAHFVRMGFTIVPHIWVPEKIAHDCTSCSLFRRCGQHAVMLPLRAGVEVGPERPAAVIHGSRPAAGRRLALRPVPAEAIPA
jgi:amino-acid N-acetyltransferase